MSGTIQLSDTDKAYLKAAQTLRTRFPEAAAYLERLVYDNLTPQPLDRLPSNSLFPWGDNPEPTPAQLTAYKKAMMEWVERLENLPGHSTNPTPYSYEFPV